MKKPAKIALWVLFWIYIIILLRITVFRSDFGTHPLFSGTVLWVPFVSLYEILQNSVPCFIYLFVGNLIWFAPLGFLLPCLTQMRKSVPLLALGLSVVIEVLQFTFATGVTEVEDVILNTLGGCLGYGVYWAVKKLLGEGAVTEGD